MWTGSLASAVPATKTANHCRKNEKKRKSIAHATQNSCRHVCRHVRKSGSTTPATQNAITTCLETFDRERFCSFPHRHSDGTRKQETQDQTCWSIKTNMSPEISSNFQTWWLQNYNVLYEFSYGPTSKSTFRARLPSIFITCHKTPRLPQNLHVVTNSRSADNAICKKHGTRHV